MSVTELDCRRQIRRLLTVFNTGKSEEELVEGWMWVLAEDLNPTDLMAAVSEYAKTGGRFFPSASQIRELALKHRTDHGGMRTQAKPTHDGLACPACGQRLRILEPAEQVLERWDDETREQVNARLPAIAPRFGILHDLSVPHEGLPVEYGRYRLQKRLTA